jgi:hypothetical protein
VDELVVLIDRWGPQGLAKKLALVRQQGFSGSDLFFDDSLRPHLPLEP